MTSPTSATVRSRFSPAGRIIGLDFARGLALFAMMVTHIFALSDPDGLPTWAAVFAGRASALFAVLAGCSLVLSTRSRLTGSSSAGASDAASSAAEAPRAGSVRTGSLRDVAPGVLIRAGAIVIIGFSLGTVSTFLAVILVNYGIMFALALLFLRLRSGALFAISVGWMVLSPVVSMIVRDRLELVPSYLPMSWFDLVTPVPMLTDLLLTGYYPILQWLSYILLGMAIAKLDIDSNLVRLFAAGVGLFLVGKVGSWLLLDFAGGGAALVRVSELYGTDLNAALFTGSYGVTPTTSWWWLAIAGPHSATPFDLFATAGTAVATIAMCQSVVLFLGRRAWMLAPLTAPGSMPLSVYSAHVLLIQITHPLIKDNPVFGAEAASREMTEYLLHAFGLATIAILWKLCIGAHGPLEAGISAIIRALAPTPDRQSDR